MIKLQNREDVNKYYKIVNEIIDKFIDNTNARPKEVYVYINKNMRKFLDNNKLSEVVGIERVVSDVIEHRKSLQDDNILTFENFTSVLEDISDLKSNNVRKEKILADFFHISSGHIDTVNQDLNIYKVKDFDESYMVTCLSENDLNQIRTKLKNLLTSKITSQKIQFDPIVENFIGENSDLNFNKFIDDTKLSVFLDQSINSETCIKYFEFFLNNSNIIDLGNVDLEFIANSNGYKIWKIVQN